MKTEENSPDLKNEPKDQENAVEEAPIQEPEESTEASEISSENASEPASASSASISADLQDLLAKFEQRMKDRAQEEEGRERAPEGESTIERLQRELREKDATLRKYIAGHKEAVRQFEQSRVRLQKDVQNQVKLFTRKFLEDLLDVVDDLDRAIESFERDPNAEGFFEGVGMVHTQFLRKLKNLGVERMNSLNAPFDPLVHEAISTVPVEDEAQDGAVVGIVKEGYTIDDEVLRPATVAVGKRDPSKTS